jgi:hypothetical protein
MWQEEDDGAGMIWSSAVTYCDGLSLGGYDDWRLPGDFELASIAHYGNSGPAINTAAFTNTKSAAYWTATSYAYATAYAWYVDFTDGSLLGAGKSTTTAYAKCVRGGEITPGVLTDNGDATVSDDTTELMWQQADDGATRTWEAALTYCEGLALAGHTDWRVPNARELRSIVDSTQSDPAMAPSMFPTALSEYYWSSTSSATYTPYAWGVNFKTGNLFPVYKTDACYIRCVRGG